ncbi:MAG: hypothetical protein EAY72_01395 [Bacteroidetes bacterium]|nr:MAG: hypothetical protein EAY72_01395 [Bacteroidota bacterium]
MLHTDANPEDEPVTDPSLLRVIARLEQNDVKTIRLRNLLKNYRKPFYNKSLFVYPKSVANSRGTNSSSTSSADTTVLIPLVTPRQQVVPAFIKATLGTDSVNLSLHFDVSYPQYGFADSSTTSASYPAEGYALTYMKLNQAVFNYNLFRINDRRLFHKGRNYTDTVGNRLLIRLRDPNVTNNSRMEYIVNCNEFTNIVFHCPKEEGHCTGPGGACDGWPCPICTTTSYTTECETFTIPSPGGSSGSPIYVPPSPPTTGPSGGGTGGGGNGPDPNTPPPPTTGWTPEQPTPPTNNHTEPVNPCDQAKKAAERMDSLYAEAKCDSLISTLPNLATDTAEHGIVVMREYVFTNYVLTPRNLSYGTMQQGNGSNVTTPPPTYAGVAAGSYLDVLFHTHTPGGQQCHSPRDIYNLLAWMLVPPNRGTGGSIVATAEGNKYAMTITDKQKAANFLLTRNQYLNESTGDWILGSDADLIRQTAQRTFISKFYPVVDVSGKEKVDSYTMAAILAKFDVGLSLSKQNAEGKFEPIVVSATPNRRDPTKTNYSIACN